MVFDENLTPKLPCLLEALFPGNAHLRECGLLGFPDEAVWDYARDNGFVLVAKDSDFKQRSLLYGHPPKIVWLRIGNYARQALVQLSTAHEHAIHALDTDPLESMLIVS